jgi:nicotinate-nucleotide adenylyltransferase
MRIYFGGTFDPVHQGHVRLSLELSRLFQGEKVYLMPCHKPVHKGSVQASPEHRLAMLKLALADYPELEIDTRELMSTEPSYTFNSLCAIRTDVAQEPVAFVIGTDSLLTLPGWYRSDQLAGLTHLIVIERPRTSFILQTAEFQTASQQPEQQGIEAVLALGFQRAVTPGMLEHQPAGLLLSLQLSELDISSSDIRQRVREHKSLANLVSDAVAVYISEHKLYQHQEK